MRVIIVIATVVIGLTVASVPLFAGLKAGSDQSDAELERAPASSTTGSEAAPAQAEAVDVSQPVECPEPPASAKASANAELADVELPCLTTGGTPTTGSLADQLAGRVSIVNVWAWWCAPCREELPMMEALRQKHPEWNVVGVHEAKEGQAGVDFLEELGVRNFPSYQDAAHTFDAATGIPKVVPITLIYREDGTRAAMLPKAFTSEKELESAVNNALNGAGS